MCLGTGRVSASAHQSALITSGANNQGYWQGRGNEYFVSASLSGAKRGSGKEPDSCFTLKVFKVSKLFSLHCLWDFKEPLKTVLVLNTWYNEPDVICKTGEEKKKKKKSLGGSSSPWVFQGSSSPSYSLVDLLWGRERIVIVPILHNGAQLAVLCFRLGEGLAHLCLNTFNVTPISQAAITSANRWGKRRHVCRAAFLWVCLGPPTWGSPGGGSEDGFFSFNCDIIDITLGQFEVYSILVC